ncbi:PREDICTED: uncharacterized protein LOC104802668 isoform X2 [Tarenaya hassleriana]|uniref:uncharacterized protein LOC104802668 isoform X2 n=1 Tax=Tarenaya hassleriana TaxID=28532 RepID=UPI00053C995F|nr:PREDICTED: uncharacterized protein LOC104802668 isoform X2 [Tarenaya hassleriana]
MPSLAQRNEHYSFGFWSKDGDGISYNQLQKFWSELPSKARQELLRIDKQMLFEQARKNMYCSRCNGLLLEGFLQIVMYGKSLQQDGSIGNPSCNRSGASKDQDDCNPVVRNGCADEMQDPSVHPWGGLTTTRDGSLTLLDCYLYAKSLKGLQNVFDSARARERERELLYPDACGGGGRGWISQGMASYGRGHGTRETCALHTARLSCDTLVDFWSALGDETRQSLLRMKEEDFIERLMYRFDSKRFCRDCRRNVIREFKELKELKRMRREPQCTTWFCVADTDFQYEVSIDSVQADWRQTFTETAGIYHHFEWAIGTGEGKSDILEFENVGMSGSVQVNGLDLRGLNTCYITLRAIKLDGRCSEISVKAHALKGQQCVHCRLVVGDGFVSIRRGESIRRFFEHAEEAEEEEDEDLMDKDGNELDGECSRPQKHAKSPELAREFLLDAATVIFKEQVEKAFREGTARQNAHSIFVCLALKLLEQRVHVACKEIITLEKQVKLLEEEEKEKREEEERKERKRTKEREKKLRRKERLKEKERGKEKKNYESSDKATLPETSREEGLPYLDDEMNNSISCKESVNETGDVDLSPPGSSDDQDGQCFDSPPSPSAENQCSDTTPDGELIDLEDENGYFTNDQPKPAHPKAKFWNELHPDHAMRWPDRHRCSENASFVGRSDARHRNDRLEVLSRCFNGTNRQLRVKSTKGSSRNGIKCNEKFQCTNNRMSERYDSHSCSCKQSNEFRAKAEPNLSATRGMRESKPVFKSDSVPDASHPVHRSNRYTQTEYVRDGRPKSRATLSQNPSTRDSLNTKKVWEPLEPKKYPRNNTDSDITLSPSMVKAEDIEHDSTAVKSSPGKATEKLDNSNHKDSRESRDCINSIDEDGEIGVDVQAKNNDWHLKDTMSSSISNSDNCSSCLSEGDSNTGSLKSGNTESSLTSDSEDASQHFEGRENSLGTQNDILNCHEKTADTRKNSNLEDVVGYRNLSSLPPDSGGSNSSGTGTLFTIPGHSMDNMFPVFQAPSTMGYFHQAPVSWPAAPSNGLMPFPPPAHYLYAGPLGYGLNGGDSQLCMQYGGPLNHSASPPFFHSGHVPVFHPFARANSVNTEEQAQTVDPSGKRSLEEEEDEGISSCRPPPMESPSYGGSKNGDCAGGNGDDSFSLFHFGGPVALAAGCKTNPVRSKAGNLVDSSLQSSADDVSSGDLPFNKTEKEKESTVEEYNLFAATNGIRFSLF